MRFNHRSPSHWIAVAIVVVLGLFTFNYAGGQGKPAAPDLVPEVPPVPAKPEVAPGKARSEVTLAPRKDSVAQEQRSPARTAKRAARRTIERSRTGVGGIDSSVGSSR